MASGRVARPRGGPPLGAWPRPRRRRGRRPLPRMVWVREVARVIQDWMARSVVSAKVPIGGSGVTK